MARRVLTHKMLDYKGSIVEGDTIVLIPEEEHSDDELIGKLDIREFEKLTRQLYLHFRDERQRSEYAACRNKDCDQEAYDELAETLEGVRKELKRVRDENSQLFRHNQSLRKKLKKCTEQETSCSK